MQQFSVNRGKIYNKVADYGTGKKDIGLVRYGGIKKRNSGVKSLLLACLGVRGASLSDVDELVNFSIALQQKLAQGRSTVLPSYPVYAIVSS